jgi:hypothetical protein
MAENIQQALQLAMTNAQLAILQKIFQCFSYSSFQGIKYTLHLKL